MGGCETVRHARAATSRPPSRVVVEPQRFVCGRSALRGGILNHLEGAGRFGTRAFALSCGLFCAGGAAASAHPVIERFKTECLPQIEAEAVMSEGDMLLSETHKLRWLTMKSGASACVVSIRDDFLLPDDSRAEEQARRRAVAEEMRVAAAALVDGMISEGYKVCVDTSTDKEHNTLLAKPLPDGRSISSLIWMLPEYPIAVMNAGVLTKEETEDRPCEMETS